MAHKILGSPSCPAVQKLLIAADFAGCHSVVETPKGENKPLVVVTPEKAEIEGSGPGLRYFARLATGSGLLGDGSAAAEALVDSMMYKIDHDILIPLYSWVCMTAKKETDSQKALDDVKKSLTTYFNPRLLHSTYLVGERLTVADIHLACSLHSISPRSQMEAVLKSLDNVERWLDLIINNERVKKYLNSTTATAAAAPKPVKVEKPAKKENPLDILPPSPLVLDAWKREYSNSKDLRGVSMPWFWKNYDAEGYSLWYMRYDKTEDENTVDYATSNMLSGFLQRIDNNFRKYSFAVVNVVGETGNFDILGVWLFRGLEIPEELQEHPSFQYYQFRKLDMANAADKQLVEDYWCNDEIVESRPISSCKVWK